MLWNPTREPPNTADTAVEYNSILVDTTAGTNGLVVLTTGANDDIIEARHVDDLSTQEWQISETAHSTEATFLPNGDFAVDGGRFDVETGTKDWSQTFQRPVYDSQLDYILDQAKDNSSSVTAYDPADGSEITNWGGTAPNALKRQAGFATSNNRLWVSAATAGDTSSNYPRVEMFDIADGSHMQTISQPGSDNTNVYLHTSASYCYSYVAAPYPDTTVKKIDETGSVVQKTTLNQPSDPLWGTMSYDGSVYLFPTDTTDFNDPFCTVVSLSASDLSKEWSVTKSDYPGAAVVADTNSTAIWPHNKTLEYTDTSGTEIKTQDITFKPSSSQIGCPPVPTGERVIVASHDDSTDPNLIALDHSSRLNETWADAKTRPYHATNSRLRVN